ncbi:carboxyltransferase domain-containing protein [Microbacterium sp. JZ37]|uniref:5-oxoprolinase subunit B/C family protein n=1 Tax=Microbacterium sp. JZ37 TaxID=2654193 RepID=UPI002B48368F|nr:carboxyltransferase domain-containing protein [Microbacterium sp. JZ37]WRH17749.1 carboxyltransferase domain-containing protein [Microbacterium sp. JZ37]
MRRILTASGRALLVEVDDLESAVRLHAALEAAPPVGVVELVPAERTVLVRCEPRRLPEVRVALERIALAARAAAVDRCVEIPVHYDGDDLAEVADHLGLSPAEVAARHQTATWHVAFTGFAPGFGYLVGDDPVFDVPRKASPRARVPAGAVALAGRYSGVYPRESPGGWQLIGRTDAALWDLDRDPPALLLPGTTVRFVDASRAHPATAAEGRRGRPAPLGARAVDMPGDRGIAAAVEVIEPGLQLLVQDLGRPGRAHLGVSASGAADRGALRAANAAVGNGHGEAGLELLGGGARLRLRGAGVLALAGAEVDAALVHADGGSEPVPRGAPTAFREGDELVTGFATRGVRALVAFRGGLALTPVLGSLATDTLAGIGPRELGGRALRAGDVVPLRGLSGVRDAVAPWSPAPRALPAPGETVELRVVRGPRDDWFAADALDALLGDEWAATSRSDRVGIRLEGARPLARAVPGELPSEGTETGAVQVPPHGHPVVFLPDHPLTGGYPVIASVVAADLDLAGQIPPGARVRFRLSGADVGRPS